MGNLASGEEVGGAVGNRVGAGVVQSNSTSSSSYEKLSMKQGNEIVPLKSLFSELFNILRNKLRIRQK